MHSLQVLKDLALRNLFNTMQTLSLKMAQFIQYRFAASARLTTQGVTTKCDYRYCQMPPGGQPPPSEKHCPKPLPAFCPRCHWSRASSEKVGITSGSNSDGWPGEFTTRNLSQKKESPYLSKHIKVYVRDTS